MEVAFQPSDVAIRSYCHCCGASSSEGAGALPNREGGGKRERWGSILPFPTGLFDQPPSSQLLRRSLTHRLRADLPAQVEYLPRSLWPPPWRPERSHPRLTWLTDPIPDGPDRLDRMALLDSLHSPLSWMVYCDGSFVWRPDHPDHSKAGAGALLMLSEHVVDFQRLGLGSYSHSRDAELHALCCGLTLLERNPPPPQVHTVCVVSDAALALRQLRFTRPEFGYTLALQWYSRACSFLALNPQIHLTVIWGPSKSTVSLQTADELAKRARTKGLSPTASLRFIRMNLKNTQLLQWRGSTMDAETRLHTSRLSAPYMRPSRRPPHWLAFPRPLQARIAQLLTGRAVLQPFLHLINSDEYESQCPFGDGPGTLGHFIEQCQATSTWRKHVRKDLGDEEPLPSWQELLALHPHYLFALIDHSALGAQSFAKKIGPRRIRPLLSFWKPPRRPLQGPPVDFHYYAPPSARFPLARSGPISARVAQTVPVIPDQDFTRHRALPLMRREEHAAPHSAMHPLRETIPASPVRLLPTRRSARTASRPPLPTVILQPPGRPPDGDSPSARLRSSPLAGPS